MELGELRQQLEQRMYCLVLYNISPIQQGIQSLHAVVEYARAYYETDEYRRWSEIDKTVIVLNGGTSKTMIQHIQRLYELHVQLSFFQEPDLYGGTTAICFLADERIWNREKYPDRLSDLSTSELTLAIYRTFDLEKFKESIGGEDNFQLKEFLSKLRLT